MCPNKPEHLDTSERLNGEWVISILYGALVYACYVSYMYMMWFGSSQGALVAVPSTTCPGCRTLVRYVIIWGADPSKSSTKRQYQDNPSSSVKSVCGLWPCWTPVAEA